MFTAPRSPARQLALGVGLAALALVAACGAGESTTTDRGDTSQSALEQAEQAVADRSQFVTDYPEIAPVDGDVSSLAGQEIWYVPLGSAAPGLRIFGEGLEEGLANLDADVQVCDGKFVPTTVAACLEQAGASGADAVVTGYVDYQVVSAAVDTLVESGVPVLMAGTPIPEGMTNTPELSFDDTSSGQNLAQELTASAVVADSGGDANVLYVAVTDSPTLIATAEHTLNFFEESCPSCDVTKVEYNTASIDKLPSLVSAALIQNPETNYIVTEVDTAMPFAMTGAQSAGFAEKVKGASTGADLNSLEEIASGGRQFANTGFSTIYAGWRFADSLVRMLVGGVPETDTSVIRVFNSENVANLELAPEAFATIDWYGTEDFHGTFLKAWGVS